MLWRLLVRLNFTLPVAVNLKRFAAAFFVFSFMKRTPIQPPDLGGRATSNGCRSAFRDLFLKRSVFPGPLSQEIRFPRDRLSTVDLQMT